MLFVLLEEFLFLLSLLLPSSILMLMPGVRFLTIVVVIVTSVATFAVMERKRIAYWHCLPQGL